MKSYNKPAHPKSLASQSVHITVLYSCILFTLEKPIMKKILLALALTASSALMAQDVMGGLVGGAIGGVIGNQFGGGSGKTAATIGGAVLGTMIGSSDQRGYTGNNYRPYNTYSGYNGYTTREVYREDPQVVYTQSRVIYTQPRVVYVNPAPVYYGWNHRDHEWHDRDRGGYEDRDNSWRREGRDYDRR